MATYNAATCSQADILAQLGNCAASGDTIQLPAGSATWTANLTLSGKSVTLLGAAALASHITISYSASQALTLDCTSNIIRVSGIDWILSSTVNSEGAIQFIGANTGTQAANARFDNNTLTLGNIAGRALGMMFVWGLVDHNSFVQTSGASLQFTQTYGSSDQSGDSGQTPWNYALSLGTNNAVYYEDNTFDQRGCSLGDDCLDAYGGARIVIRHNNFLDCSHGFHGMDSGSRRSCLSFEVYSNTYTNNGTKRRYCTVRGGTGVFYSNSYAGSAGWDGVTLQYYRAYQGLAQGISFQQCDGTIYYFPVFTGSSSGAAPLVTSGGRAFDNANNRVLGANGGGSTTPVDGAGTAGYPGRDQPGWAPGMIRDPVYTWLQSQTGGGGLQGTNIWAGCASCPDDTLLQNFLQSGREWVDNGSTAKPGYTAYTYPYPWGGSSSSTLVIKRIGRYLRLRGLALWGKITGAIRSLPGISIPAARPSFALSISKEIANT